MRIIKLDEQKKMNTNGIRIVEKFLKQLDGISSVSRDTQGRHGADLSFSFGKNNRTGMISVVTDKPHSKSLFVETYITEMQYNQQELTIKPGQLYVNQSNFLFYLAGNLLYTIPLKKFRVWVDINSEMFCSECEVISGNGNKERRHGLLIPTERIRRDFAKGNVHVSIYQLLDNPNSESEIDFIQEL